jgi:hypothetical protein
VGVGVGGSVFTCVHEGMGMILVLWLVGVAGRSPTQVGCGLANAHQRCRWGTNADGL